MVRSYCHTYYPGQGDVWIFLWFEPCSCFVCLEMIPKWSFCLIMVRVALTDVSVLWNCLCSTRKHHDLPESASSAPKLGTAFLFLTLVYHLVPLTPLPLPHPSDSRSTPAAFSIPFNQLYFLMNITIL